MEGMRHISLIGFMEKMGFFRMECVRLRIVTAGALRKCDLVYNRGSRRIGQRNGILGCIIYITFSN